jgi:hypothetical protein
MSSDQLRLSCVGRVRQTSDIRGLLFEKKNLVVNVGVELMAQALTGGDQVASILFGLSGGVPVTPGLTAIYNPVNVSPAGASSSIPPVISDDVNGLASIVTWSATWTNNTMSSASYDMLGLVSANTRLFAALSFEAVTLAPNESIVVEWTILLRGSAS